MDNIRCSVVLHSVQSPAQRYRSCALHMFVWDVYAAEDALSFPPLQQTFYVCVHFMHRYSRNAHRICDDNELAMHSLVWFCAISGFRIETTR